MSSTPQRSTASRMGPARRTGSPSDAPPRRRSPSAPPAPADSLPAGLPGWGRVTPFVLRRSSQFEPDGPPPLASRQYARDYNEVKAIGEQHSTLRTAEQTMISRFWYENSGAGWSRIARIVAQSS